MRIGYACTNTSLECTASSTFRLRSFSRERLVEAVNANLDCLEKILEFNRQNNILFFRITSDLVPFASHPINDVPWQEIFRHRLRSIGMYVFVHGMRISMHPDSFNVLNSESYEIVANTARELKYHTEVLDLMGLDETAKVQLHIGGVYGDKPASMKRFAANYRSLPENVRSRLVIENDGLRYGVQDCLAVHEMTGVPLLFDALHYQTDTRDISLKDSFIAFSRTWEMKDGLPLVDFGTQKKGGRPGSHAALIDMRRLKRFTKDIWPCDCDIMIEAKAKEENALKAVQALKDDPRLIKLR